MKKILIISLIFITFNLNFALAQTAPLDVNLLQQLVEILQKLIQQNQIQLPQVPAVPMQESPKTPLRSVPSEIKLIHPEKLELPKEVKPALPEIDKTKPFIPEVIRPILPDETKEDDAIVQLNNLKITRIILNPGINDVKAVFFAVRDINWRCMFWETEESPTFLACPQYLLKPILEKELAIQISNDTNLLLKNRKKAKIDDFNVGDKINVYGFMDKDNYSIDALIVRKIASTPKPLPPIPVPTPPVPVPPPIPTPPIPISPTSVPPALQSQSIKVLFPNGGERLEIGKTYAIEWTSNNVKKVNIYLENWGNTGAGGPLTWLIAQNVDALDPIVHQGLFVWTVSQDIIPKITPGNLYKIKIEQSREESPNPISDSSENFFSIVESSPINIPGTPSLQVVYPNGFEKWEFGKTYTIRWNSNNVNRINIFLEDWSSPGGGAIVYLIGKNINATLGSWSWTVSDEVFKIKPGSFYRIKIRQIDEGVPNPLSDYSDDFFSIVGPTSASPSIQVLSPNGGEKLELGKPYPIRWNANNVNRINVYLENWGNAGAGGPQTWLIMKNVDASLGLWYWAPPQDIIPKITPGNLYKIKIEQVEEESRNPVSDSSDNFFSIVGPTSASPSIQVLSPNGGEKLELGKPYPIRWNANNVNRINVYLENWGNAGAGGPQTWLIMKNVDASLGLWYWAPPQDIIPKITPGNLYKIKIEQVEEESRNPISDSSDNFFSIVESSPINIPGTPSLQVVYPNGFEKWEFGKTYTIRWNFQWSPIMNVEPRAALILEYYDGRYIYRPIANQILMKKSLSLEEYEYNWTIPSDVPANRLYKICVEVITQVFEFERGTPDYIRDCSDNVFTISSSTSTSTTTPTLGITSPRPQTPPQVRKGTNATLAKFYFTAAPGIEDINIRSIKFKVMKNVLEPGATSTTLQPGDLGNISIFDGETGEMIALGLWSSVTHPFTPFIGYPLLKIPAGKTKIIEIKADIPINTSAKSFGTYLSNTDVEAYGNFERRATVLGSGEWYVEVVE
jgi:hypothetical protein